MHRSTKHFGVGPDFLDWTTMEYRWFGVVWCPDNTELRVLKYRFEDSQEALRLWLHTEEYEISIEDPSQTSKLYRTIRIQQQERDWTYRKTMPILTVFKKPWRDVERGWYAIRSKPTYPFVITAVQRQRHKVTAHHLYICESEDDLNSFITRVNEEQEIRLQYLLDL